MRCLRKLECPPILERNHAKWLADYLADRTNSSKRYRYRDDDIKGTLREEAGWKCVYCESKIGHNTPGDVEHKIPTSKDESKHFTWDNLTIACTECNRRKRDYYSTADSFLDPYVDDVEQMLIHLGPTVFWQAGNRRAEVSIRTLELMGESRLVLFLRKVEVLHSFANLLERWVAETTELKQLLWKRIEDMTAPTAEYSAMLKAFLEAARARGL